MKLNTNGPFRETFSSSTLAITRVIETPLLVDCIFLLSEKNCGERTAPDSWVVQRLCQTV